MAKMHASVTGDRIEWEREGGGAEEPASTGSVEYEPHFTTMLIGSLRLEVGIDSCCLSWDGGEHNPLYEGLVEGGG